MLNPSQIGATCEISDIEKDPDVILVAVKAWQVKEVAEKIKPLIGANTVVIPLQNGVDAPAELSSILGTIWTHICLESIKGP